MKMPNLFVNAVATWDGKALTKGQKQIQGFEKGVKNLGKALGLSLGAAAIVQFGKASAKAFISDEAAANRLTTAVKNLGLGFEDQRIKNFVSTIEAQTGVLDDKLRPALQSLLTTTGSVAKSQELLKLAIEVAAGSGKDLTTVATDLSQAYVGNTKGLKKYYLGLTQAELKAASFTDIQTALNKQFAGSNSAYLDTYSGKISLLTVGFENMKETIGQGLLDSFSLLAGDQGIGAATSAMDNFGQSISDATYGAASLIDKLDFKLGSGGTFFDFLKDAFIPSFQPLIDYGAKQKLKPKPFQTGMTISGSTDKQVQEDRKRAAAEAEAARRAKELLAMQNKTLQTAAKTLAAEKKRLLLEKAKAALTKAAAVFDLNKISIAAALKNTYDKDERLRLLAMQEIENENGEAALKYIEQLNLLTKEQQTNKLAGITTISETELNYINQLLLDELARIKATKMSEEEAAAARAAAYAKYNAAIIASGGLGLANFYSEKTQIELLTIARLAALDSVAAAQATMDILNYTSQTDIIARIAAAQKLADEAKMTALKAYLTEASKPITQTITTKYVVENAGDITVVTTPKAKTNAEKASELLALGSGAGAGTGSSMFNPYAGGNSAGFGTQGTTTYPPVVINIAGSVLDGDDFTDKVTQAMINGQRKGLSQYAAGALPGGG